MIDITKARRETPGCENAIHFNNAGAALMPDCVIEAVIGHIRLEAQMGGYEAAAVAHDNVERVYDAAKRLLNCGREEIAVVENATRAWDMAFYGIPFREGDRILTAKAEYASNYIAFLQVAKRTGAVIDVVPNDEYGQVSVQGLRNLMDDRVKLIAITHVPTNGGLVNPAQEIGQIAKQSKALYLLDACQSVGQMPIDVQRIGCDILTATGRKYLRAPRGTGLLYVNRAVIEELVPPFLDLHAASWVDTNKYVIRADARRFENWETNYAGKIGLGVAIEYALSWGLQNVRDRISSLAGLLRVQLIEMPGVTVWDIGLEKCGIVTFTVKGYTPEHIQEALAANGVHTSVSLPEYTRLDMTERKLDGLNRASVHYYNTEEEIHTMCNRLKRILKS